MMNSTLKNIMKGCSTVRSFAVIMLAVICTAGCGMTGNELSSVSAPSREVAQKVTMVQTATPRIDLIAIHDLASPAADTITGVAGAVPGNSVINIYEVYPGGTVLYTCTAAANGSFTISIGDDDPRTLVCMLTATETGKSESAEICLVK